MAMVINKRSKTDDAVIKSIIESTSVANLDGPENINYSLSEKYINCGES
jgi:hypothetical protein